MAGRHTLTHTPAKRCQICWQTGQKFKLICVQNPSATSPRPLPLRHSTKGGDMHAHAFIRGRGSYFSRFFSCTCLEYLFVLLRLVITVGSCFSQGGELVLLFFRQTKFAQSVTVTKMFSQSPCYCLVTGEPSWCPKKCDSVSPLAPKSTVEKPRTWLPEQKKVKKIKRGSLRAALGW